MDSSTSSSETNGDVFLFAFIPSFFLLLFHPWFPSLVSICFYSIVGICIYVQYFFNVAMKSWYPWIQWEIKLQTENVYKSYQKFIRIIYQKQTWNFDQWKVLSENCKPIGVFVYKITENNRRSRCFAELIKTRKRYPISLDMIYILTGKLL